MGEVLIFLFEILRFEQVDLEFLGMLPVVLFIIGVNTACKSNIMIKSYYLLKVNKIVVLSKAIKRYR